ncbi:MAG: hypothetical protein QME96_04550 [Myxococcota bacterium]|nr:hypothetical protein [Myxococcota bacterium]
MPDESDLTVAVGVRIGRRAEIERGVPEDRYLAEPTPSGLVSVPGPPTWRIVDRCRGVPIVLAWSERVAREVAAALNEHEALGRGERGPRVSAARPDVPAGAAICPDCRDSGVVPTRQIGTEPCPECDGRFMVGRLLRCQRSA